MSEYAKIVNYNVANAYVDTTFIQRDGSVLVSNFSSDDGNVQERTITNTLRVSANDGYKFDLDNLEDYYFDVQFQPLHNSLGVNYNDSLPFTRVSLADFEPVTDISSYEWVTDMMNYPLYNTVDSEGSMYYTFTVGNSTHLILLYGGLRERDLVFSTFTRKKSSNNEVSFTMNGEDWVSTNVFSGDFLEGQ